MLLVVCLIDGNIRDCINDGHIGPDGKPAHDYVSVQVYNYSSIMARA